MLIQKLRVVRNEAQQSAQIFLYGIVGDYWDWENDSPVTARNLQRKLAELNDYPMIHLHLNGPGGDVHEGLLIVNTIRASKKVIHTWNDGVCASMMAIILESVPKERRHAAKASLTMFHKASTFAWGNTETLRETADMLEKHDDVLIDILCDALELTPDGVKALWFDGKDHWLTAQDGEKAGLFTIEDYDISEIPENVTTQPMEKIAAFYRTPSNFTNNTDMGLLSNKFKSITALAKVAVADRTPDHFKAINDELEAEGIKGATLVSDLDLQETMNAAEKVPALETKVNDLETAAKAHDKKVVDLQGTIDAQNAKLALKPGEAPAAPAAAKPDGTPADGMEVEEIVTAQDKELIEIERVSNLIP